MATDSARLPSSRAVRNQRAILDAALTELHQHGWAGLLPSRVAERAGLSITPVRTRYSDRSGLAVALWDARLGAHLLDHLQRLIDVMGTTQPRALSRGLEAAFDPFVHPDAEMQAAVELLITSAFDPALSAAVHRAIDAPFAAWCTPDGRGSAAAPAAQRASLLGIALGFALATKRLRAQPLDMSTHYSAMAHALLHPSRPARLPSKGAEHYDRGFVFETGDPAWDSLLRATLDTVAEVGFEGATVERIARRSGFTQGIIFSRYANKHDLFLDASRRGTAHALELNTVMIERIGREHSEGIADAFYFRESMHPGRAKERAVLTEQLRLAMHDRTVAHALDISLDGVLEAIAAAYPRWSLARQRGESLVSFARGQGPTLLAVVVPAAWNLPYDVFTVPFHEAHA